MRELVLIDTDSSEDDFILESSDEDNESDMHSMFERHDCKVAIKEMNIIDVPDNGYCLLHAFKISMRFQNSNVHMPKFNQIKNDILKEVSDHFAVYASFMAGENCHQRMIREMNKYLDKGRFASDFVDQVPLILANLYSVNVGILSRIQNSDKFSVLWIRCRSVSSRYVCIIKIGNHYMAVSLDRCKITN